VSGAAGNPKPSYPAEARQRGIEGHVVLRVSVDANGAATTVSVLSSSGHESLDDAALAAVRRWRFVPATRAGVAVAATADVPIQFRLED
jgi:protein TonB